MKIGILTDSSAYLSPQLQKKYNIKVIPLPLIWSGKIYKDLVDIGYEQFYTELNQKVDLPTTSQPAQGEIQKYISDFVAADYTDVIVITISSGLSSFYANMKKIAAAEKAIKIHVFDSKITCAGQADFAVLAARLAEKGSDVSLILHDLYDLQKTMDVRFIVDNLQHLKRTGRLSNAATFIGGLLHMKPILSMDVQEQGKISAIAKERQYRRAYQHLQKDFAQLTADLPYPVQATVFDALDEKRKHEWLLDYRQRFPKFKFYQSIIGPVVGVHVGQHTMALIWCRDIDSYFAKNGAVLPNVNSPQIKD